jgi:hypothetical protein
MRKTVMLFAATMALALCMMACGKKTPSENPSDTGRSAGQAASDAAKATGDAVSDAAKATGKAVGDATKATGDFLSQSKDKAVKAAQDTLDGLDKKWQDLQAKAAPTTDEGKADLEKAKDEMAKALADAKAKLVEAKDATADTWQQDVKPALDTALAKAQKLYDDTAAKLSQKP